MTAPLLPLNWPEQSLQSIAQLAPLQRVNWRLAEQYGVELLVKREDLLHPELGGNKFYKLYYHLKNAQQSGVPLLTFGGAYSNHICAAARAGRDLGIKTIGVIRGERAANLSSTLKEAERAGMHLHFVSRSDYRNKQSETFQNNLRSAFGHFYCVPEGGGDLLGARGCYEWAKCALELCPKKPNYIAVASGTGGTAAGLMAASAGIPVHGFLALKGGEEEWQAFANNVLTLARQINRNSELDTSPQASFTLETNYHCGGYAKFPDYLQLFVAEFEQETGIPLDRVYTAKMFWGIRHKIMSGEFAPGTRILAFHTGGLQAAR